MSTPEQEYELLAKQENLSASDVLAAFDKLGPAKAEQFIGSWKGGSMKTNHVLESQLTGMRWAGKDFRSTEDVDPIMVYKEDGERSWANQWGHARLRQVEWRGVLSTAMVYDNLPIIDHFRYVNDKMLAGAMDSKNTEGGVFYFYLYRE